MMFDMETVARQEGSGTTPRFDSFEMFLSSEGKSGKASARESRQPDFDEDFEQVSKSQCECLTLIVVDLNVLVSTSQVLKQLEERDEADPPPLFSETGYAVGLKQTNSRSNNPSNYEAIESATEWKHSKNRIVTKRASFASARTNHADISVPRDTGYKAGEGLVPASTGTVPLLLRHMSSFSIDGIDLSNDLDLGRTSMIDFFETIGKSDEMNRPRQARNSSLTGPHSDANSETKPHGEKVSTPETSGEELCQPFLGTRGSRGGSERHGAATFFPQLRDSRTPSISASRNSATVLDAPKRPLYHHQYEPMAAEMTPFNVPENGLVVQTPHGPALLLSSAQEPTHNGGSENEFHASLPQPIKRKFQRWSDEEDNILRYAIESEGSAPYNWKKIATNYFGNSRSGLQCKSRWTKSLQPGLVLGAWQQEEDDLIRNLRSGGLKWSEIAEHLPGRIGEHVRDRFVNFLDPNLKRTPWTKGEDAILFDQQRRLGNKWTAIARFLPGRSENAVKNRWHNAKMTQRRKLRKHAVDKSRQERDSRARQHLGGIFRQGGVRPGSEEAPATHAV